MLPDGGLQRQHYVIMGSGAVVCPDSLVDSGAT